MTVTQQAAGTAIPSWTFGDRMAKARNHAGLTQGEIAERIGIARQSAVNYERDKTRPLEAILRAWLEVTGVDEHWLRTGCDCHQPTTVRLTVGCSAIELRGTIAPPAYNRATWTRTQVTRYDHTGTARHTPRVSLEHDRGRDT